MAAHLVIENATVVTMNPTRDILYGASVVIEGDRIVAVGSSEELRAIHRDAEVIDGRGKVVMPGFINPHTHLAMSLQKGVTLAVTDGLYRVMWPVEKQLTAEDCYIGALAGAAEALTSGITCAVDHYFHIEQVARATTELGLRGVLGHTIMSRLGPITGEAELEEGIDFVARWKGKHPLVHPWLAPHATDTVATDWLVRLRKVASQERVGLHLHVAQSKREQDYIREQHGMGCVEYLDSIGFLGPDVLAAHCIYIEDREIDLLAASGTHPVYCPMGHALGGRPARAWEMVQRGAPVLVATDCVCSNNVMDLVGELRIAGASQRQLTGSKEAMPAAKILEMATIEAAAALGMGDRLGALAPGYLADIVVLDFTRLNTAPNYTLLNNIVYCCNGRDVETVIVNGKVVVRDQRLLTADEGEIVREVERSGRALMRRALEGDEELAWLWERSYGEMVSAEG